MTKKIIWAAGIWAFFVALFLTLDLSTRRAPLKRRVEAEWMAHYYRNPQPDKLILFLESLLMQKELMDDPVYLNPAVHFFATVVQGDPKRLEELKDLQKNYTGESAAAIHRIIAEAENYQPIDLKSPEDLELLWAEFKATGKEEILERIIKVVDWPGTSPENRLGDAAKHFLIKNSPQYLQIYHVLGEKSFSSEGKEKKLIDQMLDVIKVNTAEPA